MSRPERKRGYARRERRLPLDETGRVHAPGTRLDVFANLFARLLAEETALQERELTGAEWAAVHEKAVATFRAHGRTDPAGPMNTARARRRERRAQLQKTSATWSSSELT